MLSQAFFIHNICQLKCIVLKVVYFFVCVRSKRNRIAKCRELFILANIRILMNFVSAAVDTAVAKRYNMKKHCEV